MPKQALPSRSAENEAETGAKVSAPAMIRDGVRRAILDGVYASGVQLRQDELAERFGTSRIPVREALRQLEAEGLVTIEANKGATVTVLSLPEVLELFEIRAALECRALRLAIPNMIDGDFEAAEAILQDYGALEDPGAWGDINWRFHSLLYAPCALPKLLGMIEANYGSRRPLHAAPRVAGRRQGSSAARALGDAQPLPFRKRGQGDGFAGGAYRLRAEIADRGLAPPSGSVRPAQVKSGARTARERKRARRSRSRRAPDR